MKILLYLSGLCSAAILAAEDIKLPVPLERYEAHVEKSLGTSTRTHREEGKIWVTVAYGDDDTVSYQDTLSVPVGASAVDVAALCRSQKGWALIGWAQGLVVIRSKDGNGISRLSWTQREAKTEGRKYIMKDGDVIIGLVYGDL